MARHSRTPSSRPLMSSPPFHNGPRFRLVGVAKDVDRNEDDWFGAIVLMPVRGGFRFPGGISWAKDFLRSVFIGHRVGSLEEIDHGGSVLVVVQANVPARRDVENSKPQLATIHPLDLRSQVDDFGLGRREPLVVLWGRLLLRVGNVISQD